MKRGLGRKEEEEGGGDERKRRIMSGLRAAGVPLPWCSLSRRETRTHSLPGNFFRPPKNDWSHLASVMQFLPGAYMTQAPGPGSAQKLIILGSGSRGVRSERGRRRDFVEESACFRGAKPTYARGRRPLESQLFP